MMTFSFIETHVLKISDSIYALTRLTVIYEKCTSGIMLMDFAELYLLDQPEIRQLPDTGLFCHNGSSLFTSPVFAIHYLIIFRNKQCNYFQKRVLEVVLSIFRWFCIFLLETKRVHHISMYSYTHYKYIYFYLV